MTGQLNIFKQVPGSINWSFSMMNLMSTGRTFVSLPMLSCDRCCHWQTSWLYDSHFFYSWSSVSITTPWKISRRLSSGTVSLATSGSNTYCDMMICEYTAGRGRAQPLARRLHQQFSNFKNVFWIAPFDSGQISGLCPAILLLKTLIRVTAWQSASGRP